MQTETRNLGTSPTKDKNLDNSEYVSYDAPPLDFSFKNICNLQELKNVQPRQGQKKQMQNSPMKTQQKHQQAKQEEQEHKQKKKMQITKLLPQNNINSIVSTLVNASAMKNISTKAKQEMQKKKKKAITIKLVCCSIMLSYNKIRVIQDLGIVLSGVMQNFQNLQWIDLSHNYLQKLDYNFKDFPQLRTLYLHCNYLSEFEQIMKISHIQTLKTFTIHGNNIAAITNFRILTISILPQLKKLDSVLISKKQRDNAIFIRSQTKKFPLPKNILKPPQQKKEQEEEQKQ